MLPLPSFTFTILDTLAPPLPSAADPSVTLWRDRDGNLSALSHHHNEERWLHVLGVASFRLDVEADEVGAVPMGDVSPHQLEDEFQRTVWPAALQLKGWEVLHASAATTRRGVVALCARSETGKSTLAFGLGKRGYPLWADDAVLLSVQKEETFTSPLPFYMRLRPASASYFGLSGRELERGRLPCPPERSEHAAETLPLQKIYLLEQVPEAVRAVSFRASSPAEALPDLLQHAIYFSYNDPLRKRLMMRHYLELVTSIPIVKITFRRGLRYVPEILDALEEDMR